MAKKIFDIVPPGYSESKEKRQSLDWGDKELRSAASRKPSGRSSSFPKFIMFFLLICLAGAGAAYFLIDAKASVEIWPKQKSIANGPEQILLKEGAVQVDYERKVIPAILIEKTEKYPETISSTGAVGSKSKASGTITLYNKYDPPKSFDFIKGTRFISSDGKIFKAVGAIKLPEAKYDKGKLVEGSVEVRVEAAEGGSDYNIPASDFSLPGLSGTNSYASVWGKSDKAMAGGSETGAKVVTKEDIEGAKKQFAESAFQKAKQDLAAAVPSGYILIDKFLSQEAKGDQTLSAQEKDARDTFEISGEIYSKALVFKESDINAYADKLASRTLSVNRLVPGSLKASYEGDSIDFSQGTAKLKLSASAMMYALDDEQDLKNSLKGQSLDYARSMFDNASETIEKADINISPFWKKNFPADPSKLEIKVTFEKQ
ncbi:MAG: hypothetical protein WC926_04515 [Candidatus Paceibacterota bacterium]|jgi:hypothetical protein